MRFRAAGGLGRRARLCFAQEHCSCSQKNQGTFRQFHFVSEFTETASRAFGSHFHFSESAFVRNCDARVHSLDTYTEPFTLAAVTDAGELRWCKHEEGLMILIPHGWITSSVAPSRRENTIVVAGRALGGSGAREGYIRAWPARGPRTVRTSALRGALRCAAPAAAWRHSEACCSAALGGARRARSSVVCSGARRRTAPAATWRRSVAYGSAALGCARWHTAVLGGTQRCSAALGARSSTAVLGSIVALDSAGFGARSGAQTPALGGVPLHSAELRILW
jgi:hypothetical protein